MFNTQRTGVAPKSLLSKTRYDGEDVYIKLCEIFFEKCYICETKEPHDIHVEHFSSHKGDIEKEFDWNNLYLACSRCNSIKSTAFDNILDCCDPAIDVFRAIRHVPPITPWANSVLLIAMNSDEKTISTLRLLDRVYNSEHSVNKKVSGKFIRTKIFDQYNLLFTQINAYYSPVATEQDQAQALSRMQKLIKKSEPYSAFVRWCLLDDQKLGPMLSEYMD
ncbi:HNH endonuclease [Pseudomonas syringae]|uniref:HNH endonuclease n=1 Tax=Pseudomonas syringae TaxID=317 RepID=UPI000463430A|nr:HNH endonuclease [Pseudomonas syringae]